MIKVYVIKKSMTRTGGPNWELFIPGVEGKIEGLRRHKKPFTYGIVSFNLQQELSKYVFKQPVEIIDKR